MSIQFCEQYGIVQCALTECTSTMFRIWSDDVSMSRNMSPNF